MTVLFFIRMFFLICNFIKDRLEKETYIVVCLLYMIDFGRSVCLEKNPQNNTQSQENNK